MKSCICICEKSAEPYWVIRLYGDNILICKKCYDNIITKPTIETFEQSRIYFKKYRIRKFIKQFLLGGFFILIPSWLIGFKFGIKYEFIVLGTFIYTIIYLGIKELLDM
jgi:hypothetical protein